MNIPRLITILGITAAATVAWFVLGATLHLRTSASTHRMGGEVEKVWGPGLEQPHPTLLADAVNGSGSTETLLPASTRVDAKLTYTPKKRGLLWHRTYEVEFSAHYEIANAGSVSRNVRVRLALPSKTTSYDDFAFQLGSNTGTEIAPRDGMVETVVLIPAGATVPLTVRYNARGLDAWAYTFEPGSRVKNFTLTMITNFDEVSFPVGATSPTSYGEMADGSGQELTWNYTDTLDARNIAMDMPKLLNAGPVIARITFFAPVSLVLFFGVLVVTGMLRNVNLHPVSYAFLAAGFFTFHLMLAYLGDVIPLHAAFLLAAGASLALVCGYLHASVGRVLSVPALIAQSAYMVLFSYSFFFDGLTGLTLTLTAVATLALLMMATVKVNWETVFQRGGMPWARKPAAA
jgi:hypothetical protein